MNLQLIVLKAGMLFLLWDGMMLIPAGYVKTAGVIIGGIMVILK